MKGKKILSVCGQRLKRSISFSAYFFYFLADEETLQRWWRGQARRRNFLSWGSLAGSKRHFSVLSLSYVPFLLVDNLELPTFNLCQSPPGTGTIAHNTGAASRSHLNIIHLAPSTLLFHSLAHPLFALTLLASEERRTERTVIMLMRVPLCANQWMAEKPPTLTRWSHPFLFLQLMVSNCDWKVLHFLTLFNLNLTFFPLSSSLEKNYFSQDPLVLRIYS